MSGVVYICSHMLQPCRQRRAEELSRVPGFC